MLVIPATITDTTLNGTAIEWGFLIEESETILTTMNATITATTRIPPMVPKIPPTMEPALTPLEVVVVELEATAAVPVPDEEGVYVIYVATVLLATTTV